MRLRTLLVLFVMSLFSRILSAQVALIAETFDNGCILPAGWQVNLTGNQNAVWYVDNNMHNDDEQGLSMNGSCFLIIDDDATGNNTPAYVCDIVTPAFDASQFPVIALTADVHYRDYGPSNESFQVLVTDGTTETLLRTFSQGQSTGDSLFEFLTIKFDLSFVTTSPNARIIFRYDDGGGFGWWASIDNVLVQGIGAGVNVVKENFNACAKPDGWETQIVTGDFDWEFGVDNNPKSSGNSMDGSCMAFFDDDIHGAAAAYSTVRLLSPWFDGSQFGKYYLSFDIIMRYLREKVSIIIQYGDGTEAIVAEAAFDLGGPSFPNYISPVLDISAFRSQKMRVVIQYDDGQDYSWWIGIDNVKVTGFGVANDICANAVPLVTGPNCQQANNLTAVFEGPAPDCVQKPVAGLWYTWTADFDGTARFSTAAVFNDVVSIFKGDCANLQTLSCTDRDEHGFTGEDTYFPVQTGEVYYLRVCGKESDFGVSRGDMCLKIEQVANAPVPPANDECNSALPIEADAPCLPGSNLHATTSTQVPALNELARSDIWYAFNMPGTAPGEILELRSNADFSDILTLYRGSCDALEEVAANHKGGRLELPALMPGEPLFLQIAGTFASVEGHVCPQLVRTTLNAPPNDLCVDAIDVPVGATCTDGTTQGATFSGKTPPCVPSVVADIWYRFVAPASGSVRINSGADFHHILALWTGDCNDLKALNCYENPLRCDGYLTVGGLTAGKTYYIQIASVNGPAGIARGAVCLKLTDGSLPPEYTPISFAIDEKCVDVDMAKLDFKLSGGLPPFTISGNADDEILPSGTTFFTVVADAAGCEKAVSGIVDECTGSACNVTATTSVTQPLCHNSTDGKILVSVAGGTGPYVYLWSNGSAEAEISGLTPGTYSVTVTDALDCEQTATAIVIAPPAIVIAPVTILQPGQGQSNGAVSVDISGGTGTLEVNWYRNGVLFIAGTEDLTDAPAGDYQLQVNDVNGCTATFDVTLTETVGSIEPGDSFYTEIFPNPARDKATLAVSMPKAQTLYLSLCDATGRALRSWTEHQVAEQNISLDLKNLPSGTYQLRIVTDKATRVESLEVIR